MSNPFKLGHAPNELRQAFAEYVETDEIPDGLLINGLPVGQDDDTLATALLQCLDIMPSGLRNDLNLPVGSTYSEGARVVLANVERQSADLMEFDSGSDRSV